MAWIELHQARQRHPKTLRLAAALDVSRREACGLLDDLWTWALDIATPDGTLPGLTCDDVAIALDYPRKRGEWLMDALIRSGYVDKLQDGAYLLHDWPDYAGRLNEKRKDTKDRVDRYRERQKAESVTHCNALQSVTKSKSNASTVPKPYPTVPKREEEAAEERASEPPDWNPFGDAPERPPADTIEAYLMANLAFMSPGNMQELDALESDGATPELIRYAVDTACAAGANRWSYVKAILAGWIAAHITTVAAAKAEQEAHKAKNVQSVRSRASPKQDNRSARFLELAEEMERNGQT